MTEAPTRGEVRQWGISLGLPLGPRGQLPAALVDRWNREHPDRPFTEKYVLPEQWGTLPERTARGNRNRWGSR